MMKKLFLILLLQSAVLMGSAQLYHVGDLYTAEDGSQGIVFFVQADGSGWAVALHDLPTNLPWSPSHLNVPNLNDIGDPFAPVSSTNDFSGYANTQQIRSTFGMSPNYAAGAVNFNFGWYLPSIYQLCILYAQLPLIETVLLNAGGSSLVSSATGTTSGYWSSSEVSTDQAWVVFFTDNPSLSFVVGSGVPQSFTKASPQGQKVRAVHDIPAPNNVYDSTLTYLWNTGSTEPHFHDVPLQSSTYVVTVSNAYGCTNTDSASVMVIDNNPQTIYDTVCQGAGYSNYGFTVSSQETAEAGEIVRTYTISAVDCESEITLILTVVPHDTVQIEQTASESFEWNGVTYDESGTYTQYFNNQDGCDSMVVLTLTIDGGGGSGPDPDTIAISEGDSLMIYLPNAITPSNDDGLNDYFYFPEKYLPLITDFEITVYNRWGAVVYHSNDKHFRWNGAINGKIYYGVVYNYVIHFYDIIERPYYLKGTFTVL
ncbi:MAG: gliding motility-associated C-terminal domain-containing protein [Bacteroidales bacterium]|nr:gliding motility-associated C-terminal domain-containing protein [Bacteroidales bacterium]